MKITPFSSITPSDLSGEPRLEATPALTTDLVRTGAASFRTTQEKPRGIHESRAAGSLLGTPFLPAVRGVGDIQPWKVEGNNTLYRGLLPTGEPIFFSFDTYGNLLAESRQDFYFQTPEERLGGVPLQPLSYNDFRKRILASVSSHGEPLTPHAVFQRIVQQLKDPFHGIDNVAQLLGFDPAQASQIEKYADNPFGTLLQDINGRYGNAIGNALGLHEESFNAQASGFGQAVLGFVPVYGQIRFIAGITARLLKNSPVTAGELRDYAETLGFSRTTPPVRPGHTTGETVAQPPDSPREEEVTSSLASTLPSQQTLMTDAVLDANAIYHLNDKQYLICDGEVVQVTRNNVYPHIAWEFDAMSNAETGRGFRRDDNKTWHAYEPLKLRGGGKLKDWLTRPVKAANNDVPAAANTVDENVPPREWTRTQSEAQLAALLARYRPSAKGYTLAHLKQRDFVIKRTVYRAHRDPASNPVIAVREGLLCSREGSCRAGDDYLADIIRHTSRGSGSAGGVLSLSNRAGVAAQFAKVAPGQPRWPVYAVDTAHAPNRFRTVFDIIMHEGPRLVAEKKVLPATLMEAVNKSLNSSEDELFFVGGDIPAAWLVYLD
ncbi:hypothetical protein [Dyella sp.]|uniref:hypothetical protein n=1 Tax=Dyella sp. TaxID=1869338 RepID=UPI002ED05E43